MKTITHVVFSVIVPYLILVSSISASLKILLISLMCGLVLIYYISKSGGWRAVSSRGRLLSYPTIILVIFSVINFVANLDLKIIYFWVGYLLLTAVAFVLSFAFESE